MKGGNELKKVGFVLLLVMVVASLVISGCAKQPAAPTAPATIKVGVLISLTGFDAAVGQPAKNGYELAVAKINQDGGVYVKEFDKKIPLELVLLDMESDPEKAIARAEALNSQYNVAIATGTTLISAAAEIFEKNKMPVVVSQMTIDLLSQSGYRYWFTIGKLNSDVAVAVLDLFDSLNGNKPTKWALLEEQFPFVIELMNFVKQDAAARGVNIVYRGQYATMAPDLSPLINDAKKAGAEVLFSGPNTPDAITIVKQSKELGFNPKAMACIRGADDPGWSGLGPMGEYVIGCPDWHPAFKFPGVDELNAAYKAKYGTNTHIAAGPCYASIQLIADAIERAGTLDREKLRDAIAASNTVTVMGQIKFRENGARIDPVPSVIQWQNGELELVWPDNLKTKSLVYPRPEPASKPAPTGTQPATPSTPLPSGPEIDWKDAKNHFNENVTVTGEIMDVRTFAPPEVVLFLGGGMGVGVGVAIKDGLNWPVDPDSYKGKTISVTGKITAAPIGGGPMIAVTDPAQIVVK
jgi:branched-chain amino acid transport system substrate-binding protein